VLAGGAGVFSAACVKALAEAGLEPDDFGSYSHSRDKIRAAKRRVMEAKIAKKNGQPAEVSAHDQLLAQSETGHLQQNALFQRGLTRGDACQNERPGPGGAGAPCYDFAGAPCGPHPSGTTPKKVGTTHWAVGGNEASVREGRAPGDPVPASDCQAVSKETARITAKGADRQSVEGLAHHDQRRRDKEAGARAASAGEVQAKQAKAVDADSAAGKGVVEGETAEECIDNFVKIGTEQMRRQVMQDYSEENLPATKAKLAAAQKAAEDRVEEQEKRRAKAIVDKDWDEVQRASQEGAWARQDAKEAAAASASADCMARQVPVLQAQMAANGGAMPPMSGSVPGRGKAARPTYGGDEGKDAADV
jgi:hypothetical protein